MLVYFPKQLRLVGRDASKFSRFKGGAYSYGLLNRIVL
jgi:hypothetical protein